MKPYSAMHTPPMTQLGMVSRKQTNGVRKAIRMHITAVVRMVHTEAFFVMATQAMGSP